MKLNNDGKKEFLKANFHQYIDITLSTSANLNENNVHQFANFILPLEKINETYDLNALKKFFNNNFNNVIFTPQNSTEIYAYEYYQGVYFIRLKPFSKKVRMHIIPKKYDASDSVLFFKDTKQNINNKNFQCTTSQYERKTDRKKVNLYYKKNVVESSNGIYKFDIKKYTKGMRNLQINMGYSYNDTNPSNVLTHFTGIIDESDENGNSLSASNLTEFNGALIDVNCSNMPNVGNYTNEIWQTTLNTVKHISDINWPSLHICEGGLTNQHTNNKLYHKTLKYFNDTLYIEENNKHHIANWSER